MLVRMDVREVLERLPEIPRLLADLGATQADLARHLAIDRSSMAKTFKGERKLPAHEAVAIADYVTVLEQRGGVTETGAKFERIAAGVGRSGSSAGEHLVPLFGFNAPGPMDRIDLKRGREIDMVAPPMTGGSAALLAVRIPNDHLKPRYRAGERVFAVRDLPPEPGKDCIVEYVDGSGAVRTYLGRTADAYRFELWFSGADGRVTVREEATPLSEVAYLHQVSARTL